VINILGQDILNSFGNDTKIDFYVDKMEALSVPLIKDYRSIEDVVVTTADTIYTALAFVHRLACILVYYDYKEPYKITDFTLLL